MSRELEKAEKAIQEIHRGIIGQEEFVEGLILALLADGHVLVESVPGLAKTRAVRLLANISGMPFKRIQFTPDLLPADITGTRIYNQSTSGFETKKGPLFAAFILADEINRAPAKVQSALLEAMEEKQITIGEETYPLPEPFFVFATQNPVEQEGTYRLPEAQLDRFLMKLVLDYPSKDDEVDIIEMVMNETAFPEVSVLLDGDTITSLQDRVREVHLDNALMKYIAELVHATRESGELSGVPAGSIEYGASPRASIALARVSRAAAFLKGRDMVLPEDIKSSALPVLRHRLILSYRAQAESVSADAVIKNILASVKVP